MPNNTSDLSETLDAAERYRWWRENISCLDDNSLIEVAFSCQIDVLSRDYTPAELMDLIADYHIESKP